MPSQRPIDNRRYAGVLALTAAFILAAPGLAQAQSASGTLSQFHGGYGAAGLSGLESPVNVSTTDANGNLVITNGVISSSSGTSLFASSGSGAGYSSSGAGTSATGSASAIGNNLSVNVSGNYNTVIVNSTQTNNGDVSATTVLNGKVNLDGGQ
jgi:holdfast attachment protein HfaA